MKSRGQNHYCGSGLGSRQQDKGHQGLLKKPELAGMCLRKLKQQGEPCIKLLQITTCIFFYKWYTTYKENTVKGFNIKRHPSYWTCGYSRCLWALSIVLKISGGTLLDELAEGIS